MVNCLEVKESPPLVFDPRREVEGAAVDQSVVRGERGHHLDKVVLVVEGGNGLVDPCGRNIVLPCTKQWVA